MTKETQWPDKFDIVIANPPYSKKLHLKFLDKAFDIAKEEVVFVHPSTSFVDTKGITSIYKKINSKIGGSLESLTLFNGNGIFGIVLIVPCCITHLVKNRVGGNFKLENLTQNRVDFCESLDQVSLFGNRKEFFKFSEKTNFEKNLHTCGTVLGSRQEHKRVLKSPNVFFVETTHISGHANAGEFVTKESNQQRNDFFVILNKPALQIKRGINPKYNLFWEFETEKEARNFIEYCKTDFARACLAKTKINQNLYNGELKAIPWMDFTQEWTDEKLYAHFNITEEEQAFIKEVIPPYYD